MTEQEVTIASYISNLVAFILLLLSWKRKNISRILFSLLFIWAALVNWKTAQNDPSDYLNYGKYAVGFYKEFIYGGFLKHITGYVSFIACCQLLIGMGLLARGIIVKISCLGAIVFLLAIAPLGLGAAFPFSITASVALSILFRHTFTKDIFRNKWWV